MSTLPKGQGLTVFVLVLLLLGFVLSVGFYAGLVRISPFGAAYVQYNAAGSQHTLKVEQLLGGLTTSTITGSAGVGSTSLSWPIANAAGLWTITKPYGAGDLGTWLVKLPSDQPSSCYAGATGSSTCLGGSYVLTSSLSQATFLSQSNNAALWNNEQGSLGGKNPFIYSVNYTSTVSAPQACTSGTPASTTNVCVVQWYIYRFYVVVNLQTAGATLSVSCYTTCESVSSLFGFLSNEEQYRTAFQSGMQSLLSSTINPAAHLSTPTQISLQLNVPALAVQSNLDWYGIIMATTANPAGSGGGTQVGSLLTTGCGAPAACSIVQSNVHTALGLWKDPSLSQPALPNFTPNLNLAGYTADQLAQLIPSNVSPTVYTKFDISDFGAGFTMAPDCFITSYPTCFQVTNPQATLTVLYDVIGSKSTFYTIPTPPAQTGTNAGNIDGQVVDGSLFWKPGVSGAAVCFTDIQGCVTGNGNGNFEFTNIAAGTHRIRVTAPGFFASPEITVDVGTGTTAHAGQIAMAPQNPWYSGNWCILPPAFPGAFSICIPWLLIFSLIGAAVLAIVIIAFIYRPRTGVVERLIPTNPVTPKGRIFISRRISREIRRGHPPKQAQAIAFSAARRRGFHVPPPPKKKD